MSAEKLPPDFDASAYLALHRDVAEAGIDAATHYLSFGSREGRAYKRAGGAGADGSEPFALSNQHPVTELPNLALTHYVPVHSEASAPIARRLITAYQHSMAIVRASGAGANQADLWTGIVDNHLVECVRCLENGDAQGLVSVLSQLGRSYTWFGGITTGIDGFNHWDKDERAIAYSYFDKLVTLAEAIGVLPVENPEQGRLGNWGRNIHRSPDEVALLIEKALGVSVVPPLTILPVSGLKLQHGALHYRHINALYTALRVRDLTRAGDAICEYGGGIGLVPLYLARFGRLDYTLFDLPIVNVISGYMLLNALGQDAVCLEGERPAGQQVKVRLGMSCRESQDKAFALALNQDSFPEIDREIVTSYLSQIERTTARYFLSINHECEHATTQQARHLKVSALLAEFPRFRREYRMPYWLRRGYVEELYAIT